MNSEGTQSAVAWDVAAIATALLFLVCLLIWGHRVHTVGLDDTEEDDGYALKTDFIRAGFLPPDPFRPLLYPILAAGGAVIAGTSFDGGRVVSSVAAALLALATYWLGRRLLTREAAYVALLCVAVNYWIITCGVLVATDMTFAAFVVLAMVLMLRVRQDGACPRDVVALAFLMSLAFFTRYTAIAFFPFALAVVAQSSTGDSENHVVRRVALFLGASFLFLIPHFALTYLVFGSPLHNENWRNVYMKLFAPDDSSVLHATSGPSTLIQSVAQSPHAFLMSLAEQLHTFVSATMVQLGGSGMAGGIFTVLAVLGLVAALALPTRRGWGIILSAAGGYLLFICATFYPQQRFLLPLVPVLYLLAATAVWSFGGRLASSRMVRGVAAVSLVAITAASTIANLHAFVAEHPYKELDAARQLETRYGTGIVVIGTFENFAPHVRYTYASIRKNLEGATNADDVHARLAALIDQWKPQFVLLDGSSRAPAAWRSPASWSGLLTPLDLNPDVLAFRTVHSEIEQSPLVTVEELLGDWKYGYTTLTFNRDRTLDAVAGTFVQRMKYRFQDGELEIRVDDVPSARSVRVGRYRLTKNTIGGADAFKFELIEDPEFPRRWALVAHWWVRANGGEVRTVRTGRPGQ